MTLGLLNAIIVFQNVTAVACSLLLCLEWLESWLLLQLLWLLLIQTKILSALELWCLVLFKLSWDFCSPCFIWPYFPNPYPFQRFNWWRWPQLSLTPIIWPMAPSCDSVNPWHVSWVSGQHTTHMPQLWNIVLWSLCSTSFGMFFVRVEELLCFVLYFHWVLIICVFFSLK